MTINWTIFISKIRILILCVAVIGYGLPMITAHASSDMMAQEMSMDCDNDMTDHSSDNSCCDMGGCDYSCSGLNVMISNIQNSSLELPKQSQLDHFINHMSSIALTSDSPPPQA